MDTNYAHALRAARNFVRAVQKAGIRLDAAYLYGSYAKGKANADSDIDIALVSRDLSGWVDDLGKIRPALRTMDSRIENVRFHPRNFRDENPLVWEIKTNGIPILRDGKRNGQGFALTQARLNVQSVVRYWRESAADDLKHARSFLGEKAFEHALFFGYRYLEKMLKAIIVKRTGQHAPYSLDLMHLSEYANLKLPPRRSELFTRATDYSLDALDPEAEIALLAKLTPKFALGEMDEIRQASRWLAASLR